MRRNTQESNQVSIGTPGFMALGCLRAGSHKLAPLTGAVGKGLSLYDSFTSYLSQADNKNGAPLLSAGLVNVTQTSAGGGDRAASEVRRCDHVASERRRPPKDGRSEDPMNPITFRS